MLRLKMLGFSDKRLGKLVGKSEAEIRALRHGLGVRPVYKRIDTCAAEFAAKTPYLYSTYEQPVFGAEEAECEALPSTRNKAIILGGGPNRIGQGIEFDYCCCHAAFAMEDIGIESIMVNCNPETVSTDYDTSDRLYFEPLDEESLRDILENEATIRESREIVFPPTIVQFGGHALVVAQGLVDVVEGVFEHAWVRSEYTGIEAASLPASVAGDDAR